MTTQSNRLENFLQKQSIAGKDSATIRTIFGRLMQFSKLTIAQVEALERMAPEDLYFTSHAKFDVLRSTDLSDEQRRQLAYIFDLSACEVQNGGKKVDVMTLPCRI